MRVQSCFFHHLESIKQKSGHKIEYPQSSSPKIKNNLRSLRNKNVRSSTVSQKHYDFGLTLSSPSLHL